MQLAGALLSGRRRAVLTSCIAGPVAVVACLHMLVRPPGCRSMWPPRHVPAPLPPGQGYRLRVPLPLRPAHIDSITGSMSGKCTP